MDDRDIQSLSDAYVAWRGRALELEAVMDRYKMIVPPARTTAEYRREYEEHGGTPKFPASATPPADEERFWIQLPKDARFKVEQITLRFR